MSKKMRPVVNFLILASQNTDNPDQVLAWVGEFLEGLGQANGMSPETMTAELRRFFDHKERANG